MQGFYFAPLQYSPAQAFAAHFVSFMQLYRPHSKTAHMALQTLFLRFAAFCRCCVAGASGYVVQPARRWRAYRQAQRLHRYQIPPPRRTLCRPAQPPIIIRYIRVQHHIAYHASGGRVSTNQRKTRTDPAHLLPWYYTKRKPGGVSVSTCTGSARRRSGTGSTWHTPPGGAVQWQGQGGRRGTIDGYRRISFGLSPDS